MERSRLFRTLRFLLCPSRGRKLREHSIKSAGDLEKVNRIVAIASINTCIDFSRQVYSQISYSVHFLLIATANEV